MFVMCRQKEVVLGAASDAAAAASSDELDDIEQEHVSATIISVLWFLSSVSNQHTDARY